MKDRGILTWVKAWRLYAQLPPAVVEILESRLVEEHSRIHLNLRTLEVARDSLVLDVMLPMPF